MGNRLSNTSHVRYRPGVSLVAHGFGFASFTRKTYLKYLSAPKLIRYRFIPFSFFCEALSHRFHTLKHVLSIKLLH